MSKNTSEQSVSGENIEKKTSKEVSSTKKEKLKDFGQISVVSELYQDVIGSLFAGMIVVMICGLLFFMILYIPSLMLFGVNASSVADEVAAFLAKIHVEVSVLYVSLSFVVGTLLCRQEINIPSAISSLAYYVNRDIKDRHHCGICMLSHVEKKYLYELSTYGIYVKSNDNYIFRLETTSDPIEIQEVNVIENLKNEYIESYANVDGKFPNFLKKICIITVYFFKRTSAKTKRFFKYDKFKVAIDKILETKFPFIGMKCYLSHRGKIEMSKLIHWCPIKKETHQKCSKIFINIMKAKILAHNIGLYNMVNKAESQIKMVNTAWYSLRVIIYSILTTIIFMLLFFFISLFITLDEPINTSKTITTHQAEKNENISIKNSIIVTGHQNSQNKEEDKESKKIKEKPSEIIYKYIYWTLTVSIVLGFFSRFAYKKITSAVSNLRTREVVQIMSYLNELNNHNQLALNVLETKCEECFGGENCENPIKVDKSSTN